MALGSDAVTASRRVTWQQVGLVVAACGVVAGMITWVDTRIAKEATARSDADNATTERLNHFSDSMARVETNVLWIRERIAGPNFREPPDDVQVPRRERTVRPGQRWKGDGGVAHAPDGGDDE